MAVEECPHCITKVIFPETGICPACQQKNFILPGKSREQILEEKEKRDFEDKINYYKMRGPQVLIGGILLTLAVVGVIVLTMMSGTFIIWWYGGIVAGLGIAGKGYSQIREAKELQYFYDKKFKKPNR